MNIYISGLNFSTTDADLNDLFSEYGEVSSARIITDRETKTSHYKTKFKQYLSTLQGMIEGKVQHKKGNYTQEKARN